MGKEHRGRAHTRLSQQPPSALPVGEADRVGFPPGRLSQALPGMCSLHRRPSPGGPSLSLGIIPHPTRRRGTRGPGHAWSLEARALPEEKGPLSREIQC